MRKCLKLGKPPICQDSIVDGDAGQDSIYCEGNCNTWLHRRCAGLSRNSMALASMLEDLFFFLTVDSTHSSRKLQFLKITVASLTNVVGSFLVLIYLTHYIALFRGLAKPHL